ncbi:Hsp20 family protein [Psychrobium sp. 1_MG-2023]|uniref:Hsp20 family protein n=1 Tax=Psychrobium sp. 1_MG-2023 TaxID=3062624 RepID=UPI000C346D07|nr:Hsp20 family protein [Psychrobium sp. 1_MG-2023]MDP2559689.1 Hsp20 family protein [Psychrobium sp. 1_MG-2023]PKF59520.1 heat-shock protein [Alteromonadales bacterium alter-6D02]
MRNIDLSPLYRSAIGFDRLAHMIESASSGNGNSNQGYPPYNIEQLSEDEYRITLAVAGFDESELDITSHQNTLLVKGVKATKEQAETKFLYQGIAERGFERKYQLADYVTVQSADLSNGLLHIELKREVPEAMKPRSIGIGQHTNKRIAS